MQEIKEKYGGWIMKTNEFIRKLRENLHLSKDYVANFLGIKSSVLSQIESGERKITKEEAFKMGKLFGVATDSFFNDTEKQLTNMLPKDFKTLGKIDQEEILNLILFKNMMIEEKTI